MKRGSAERIRLETDAACPVGDTALLERIDARLHGLLSSPEAWPRPGLLSVTVALPEVGGAPLRALSGPHVYWARDRHYRVGIGQVAATEVCGEDRFGRLEQAFSGLQQGWLRLDPAPAGLGAAAFVGFSFQPQRVRAGPGTLADGVLLVPAVLLQCKGPSCTLTFSALSHRGVDSARLRRGWLDDVQRLLAAVTGPGETPAPPAVLVRQSVEGATEQWVQRVESALRAIRRGAFEKVVLTRRVRVSASHRLQPTAVMRWLASHYPACVQFCLAGDQGALVGVSPERLVALRNGRMVTDALAGTAPRSVEPGYDQWLGAQLLRDPKALREHALVAEEIGRVLAPMCRGLVVPPRPDLLRLPTVQHLATRIRGQVDAGVSLLGLARALHPTPAVGGYPRAAALQWLAANGESDRGWYTGAVGWLEPDGDGELSVVLRCGDLRGRIAELYAGAGIVAESDPLQELAETEWKLQALLESLTAA